MTAGRLDTAATAIRAEVDKRMFANVNVKKGELKGEKCRQDVN